MALAGDDAEGYVSPLGSPIRDVDEVGDGGGAADGAQKRAQKARESMSMQEDDVEAALFAELEDVDPIASPRPGPGSVQAAASRGPEVAAAAGGAAPAREAAAAALCEPAGTVGDLTATLLSLARRLADPAGRVATASLRVQFAAWHRAVSCAPSWSSDEEHSVESALSRLGAPQPSGSGNEAVLALLGGHARPVPGHGDSLFELLPPASEAGRRADAGQQPAPEPSESAFVLPKFAEGRAELQGAPRNVEMLKDALLALVRACSGREPVSPDVLQHQFRLWYRVRPSPTPPPPSLPTPPFSLPPAPPPPPPRPPFLSLSTPSSSPSTPRLLPARPPPLTLLRIPLSSPAPSPSLCPPPPPPSPRTSEGLRSSQSVKRGRLPPGYGLQDLYWDLCGRLGKKPSAEVALTKLLGPYVYLGRTEHSRLALQAPPEDPSGPQGREGAIDAGKLTEESVKSGAELLVREIPRAPSTVDEVLAAVLASARVAVEQLRGGGVLAPVRSDSHRRAALFHCAFQCFARWHGLVTGTPAGPNNGVDVVYLRVAGSEKSVSQLWKESGAVPVFEKLVEFRVRKQPQQATPVSWPKPPPRAANTPQADSAAPASGHGLHPPRPSPPHASAPAAAPSQLQRLRAPPPGPPPPFFPFPAPPPGAGHWAPPPPPPPGFVPHSGAPGFFPPPPFPFFGSPPCSYGPWPPPPAPPAAGVRAQTSTVPPSSSCGARELLRLLREDSAACSAGKTPNDPSCDRPPAAAVAAAASNSRDRDPSREDHRRYHELEAGHEQAVDKRLTGDVDQIGLGQLWKEALDGERAPRPAPGPDPLPAPSLELRAQAAAAVPPIAIASDRHRLASGESEAIATPIASTSSAADREPTAVSPRSRSPPPPQTAPAPPSSQTGANLKRKLDIDVSDGCGGSVGEPVPKSATRRSGQGQHPAYGSNLPEASVAPSADLAPSSGSAAASARCPSPVSPGFDGPRSPVSPGLD
eukprot:tig00000204_g17716.t1